MKPFSKILVPTDFSTCADLALDRALDLRQRYGAALTLLHAYQLPITYTEPYAFSGEIIRSIEEAAEAQMAKTKDRAERIARELGAKEPKIDAKVVCGVPALWITDEARGGGYDLIVMGTHGRGGLSHLILGSVAERVVRTATCPVLTVRGAK